MTLNAAAFTAGMVAAAVGVTWWATRPYAPRVVPQWRAWLYSLLRPRHRRVRWPDDSQGSFLRPS